MDDDDQGGVYAIGLGIAALSGFILGLAIGILVF